MMLTLSTSLLFCRVFERMGVNKRDKKNGWDYRKSLLLWIGYQLKGRFAVPENFRAAMRDGKVLLALLYSILPDSVLEESTTPRISEDFCTVSDPSGQPSAPLPLPPCPPPLTTDEILAQYLDDSAPNAAELRAERIVELATAIGLGDFTSTFDVLHGVDRVNLLFCSQLLRLYPSIDTYTILITRGIQNDYCGLHFRSPVHIGTDESFRLFGTRDAAHSRRCFSPLASLVQWARQQPEESFSLIHVRDLHRIDDREASEHLLKFGVHCIEGQPGSKLVGNLLEDENSLAPNEHLINVTTGISDTVGTGLGELLQKIKERAHGFLIRVGVIGVSTDLHVNNLLFELQTRFNVQNLATCSALTAARTRRAHFAALDNIERFLNTNVFHSITDFTHWLAPNKATIHLAPMPLGESDDNVNFPLHPSSSAPTPACLRLELASTSSSGRSSSSLMVRGASPSPLGRVFSILDRIEYGEKHLLGSEDLLILDALFRNASRVVIVSKLTGGFSGSMVLLAKSFDAEGHEQGPFVVKLGQIDAVAEERTNFERVEEILGHQAPYVYASYEAHKKGGLKFAFASHCGDVSTTTTFKHTYLDFATKDQVFVDDILQKVAAALNRFYTAARIRSWNILESYDFDGHGWALAAGGSDEPSALAARIASLLLMKDPSEVTEVDCFEFQPGITFFNVWKLMRDGEELRRLRAWSKVQRLLVSFVHGDLNFSNVLIDGSTNVWLIDFQYTTKAHYLKDLSKMENDAKMEVDLQSHEEYEHAIRLTQMLHDISPYEEPEEDLREKHALLLESLPTKLRRACLSTFTIRSLMRDTNLGRETDLLPYHIIMLRYALHSMCFHHLSNWTRKWALANACSHAQHIMEAMKDFQEPAQSDEMSISSFGSSNHPLSGYSLSGSS